MHFEMNFVIDVVKKVLVVVKRVHLIDRSFAFTHVKVNLLSFFFINQIFAQATQSVKFMLNYYEVNLEIPEYLEVNVNSVLVIGVKPAHLMQIAVKFQNVSHEIKYCEIHFNVILICTYTFLFALIAF